MDQARLELLTRSPLWAIQPETLAFLLASALRATSAETASSWAAAKPSTVGRGPTKTAIIPIQGVLTKDGPAWYGSNYDTITNALETAGADPDVKRVVLHVDSPGGDVSGLQETAGTLAHVARMKHVSAIVEGNSASAAYWLTSQAHDITLTPSGEVGSVGVKMMHVDVSKALDDAGMKVTELYSGEFKTEWSPYRPLSDAAKADMQTRLDATHQNFINAVSAGRGARLTAAIKAKRLGEGRMFTADDALAHGLVDKIQTARAFYRTAPDAPDSAPFGSSPRRARLALERLKI